MNQNTPDRARGNTVHQTLVKHFWLLSAINQYESATSSHKKKLRIFVVTGMYTNIMTVVKTNHARFRVENKSH